MKKIGDKAFKGCINLKKINIPASVTSIGEEAFSGCKSLKKIEIPASVKKIGKDAFKNCKVTIRCKKGSAIYKYALKYGISYELTDIIKKDLVVSANNLNYIVTSVKASNRTVAVAGVLNKNVSVINIPGTIKINGKTYKVTAVADKAFKNNKKLTKVTIGKNVKKIGNTAFANCTKLTAITLGGQVQTIGKSAFSGCAKLAKLTLGKKVKTIGSKAFYGCKKLTKITIQTSKLTTKSVGSKAFTGVSKKAKVYLPKKKAKAYKKLLKSKGLSTKVKYQNIK